MNNYRHEGKGFDYAVPAGQTLTVNQMILFGTVLGVVFSTNNNKATAVGDNGDVVTIKTYGVFNFPKTVGAGTAIAIGAPVYYDSTTKEVTGIGSGSAAAATATITVTTASAVSDTLAGLSVDGVQLLAGPLTLVADLTTVTETQIANAINANTGVSGFSATTSADAVIVSGGTGQGSGPNGKVIVTGAVTGTMVLNTANGPSPAFAGGADATTATLIGYGWDAPAADGDASANVKLKVG